MRKSIMDNCRRLPQPDTPGGMAGATRVLSAAPGPVGADFGAGMTGKVFMISAGEFIDGVPRTWTFVETQALSLADLGWAVTLSVVDDRTSIRGIARNLRRLRAEVARSGAEVVHAQYGSVTAAV